MKAIRLHGRGGPEQLFFEDAPAPEVRVGDVLVRVFATGITPAELTWDETYQHADGTPRIPSIPDMKSRAWSSAWHPTPTIFVLETKCTALRIFRATEQRLN